MHDVSKVIALGLWNQWSYNQTLTSYFEYLLATNTNVKAQNIDFKIKKKRPRILPTYVKIRRLGKD